MSNTLEKMTLSIQNLNTNFNKDVPKSPAIIALPHNTQGVKEAIELANQEGYKVAVKSGGHSFENYSSIDEGMQINLSLLDTVEWLSETDVKIGPACILKELYDNLLPKGRLIPAGSCGTVGVGGLTLGGGYGFFSRKYGLTCDSLLEATLVDGNGQIRNTTNESELLWALKGGGNGNFGVVTELVYKTVEAPKTFTRYRFKAYKLDAERAKSLLQSYFHYTALLPETCFAAMVLNYKTMVILITNYGKPSEIFNKMLIAFELQTDKYDKGLTQPLAKALKTYYGIEHPIYFKNASAGYYNTYKDIETSIDEVLEVLFEKHGLIYQINTLGGAINSENYEATSCYPHRSMSYLSELQAYWEKPNQAENLKARFQKIQGILKQNGIDKQYRNYPDAGFKDWEKAYYGDNYDKLQALKAELDPNDLFTQVQSVKLKKTSA